MSSVFCTAQSSPTHAPDAAWANDLNKYPGLLPEFTHLLDLLQRNVQFPPPRSQSRILPLLPESAAFYAAFPNYGEAARQALDTFHQQLQESSVLRDWWQHMDPAATKKFEDVAPKFYALSQYLGDEVVISGSVREKAPDVFFVAEVRKPGLKAFLQQMIATLPASPKPALRIVDPQELAMAKDAPGEQPIILVRPDFVIGAGNVAGLRSFSARLSQHNASAFSSSPFGQRINQAYDGGVSIVGAADLHRILHVIRQNNQPKDKQLAFERSGFSDLKYLVWERKAVNGRDLSQAELSFNGPRHGAAAWLAPPRQLGSLDFVSPKALFALGLALKSPAQIFDDIQEMAAASASPGQNQNPLAMAAPMAQMLGINLKDDLLSLLTGELAVELDSTAPPAPAWRLMLGVNDPAHFQKTLTTLLASSRLEPQQSQEHGVTYYSLIVPSPAKPTEISYAFVGDYLVAASSRDALREAVELHQGGGSLAKSQSFMAALPPGHPAGLSALFYEDASALMAMGLAQAAPEIKESLTPMLAGKSPLVVCAYGDEDAIREATTSSGFDPSAMLIFGAVAVPNLLRARMAANDSGAVATLRSINAAEITYSATYPQRGFAPNLAMLGPDPAASGTATMNHAGLIDPTLGNPSCTATNWCEKSGYRFRVTAECRQKMCTEFVGIATPVSNNTGGRNFCSTSDGVIHFRLGTPMSSAVTASDCRAWPSLQ
ncbi:MAG TPA: DUF3352 domain-containing protein [Terriglobales bacterium]